MGHPPEMDGQVAAAKRAPAKRPAKRRAPGKAAAAARAENKPKTVTFRGLTLELPASLPGTLYFDFARLEQSQDSPAAVVQLLTSILGDEQVQQVYVKIAEDGVPFTDMEDVILGLFNDALGEYGLAVGEQPASPAS